MPASLAPANSGRRMSSWLLVHGRAALRLIGGLLPGLGSRSLCWGHGGCPGLVARVRFPTQLRRVVQRSPALVLRGSEWGRERSSIGGKEIHGVAAQAGEMQGTQGVPRLAWVGAQGTAQGVSWAFCRLSLCVRVFKCKGVCSNARECVQM